MRVRRHRRKVTYHAYGGEITKNRLVFKDYISEQVYSSMVQRHRQNNTTVDYPCIGSILCMFSQQPNSPIDSLILMFNQQLGLTEACALHILFMIQKTDRTSDLFWSVNSKSPWQMCRYIYMFLKVKWLLCYIKEINRFNLSLGPLSGKGFH